MSDRKKERNTRIVDDAIGIITIDIVTAAIPGTLSVVEATTVNDFIKNMTNLLAVVNENNAKV